MIKRVMAGAFVALVIGILAPLLYVLLVGIPGRWIVFIWITVFGVVTGAGLGALFPKFFGFIFEMFMDI